MFIFFMTANAFTQEKAPELLRDAVHCLVTEKEGWLAMPKGNSTIFSMAYFVDRKSYPSDVVLYLLSYPSHDHTIGYVFTIFFEKHGSHQIFNIQNNAKFAISSKGINFVEPPLGGIWTQQHLEAGIRYAERNSTYAFHAKELLINISSSRMRVLRG